jgi:site-specific DNA recombinase
LREIDALVSAIAEGMKSTSVAAKLTLLEAERETHAAQVSWDPEPPVRMHPNLAGLYRKKVESLREALADEETRTEALGILRTLIEAVLIHPIEGGYEIELVGEIANMVDLAAGTDNKKTALGRAVLDAEDRCSVKLVAGARFVLGRPGSDLLSRP